MTQRQMAHLPRLLWMYYSPSELADEIGCNVDTIYKSYIPAGCPHTRDERGRIWIKGVRTKNKKRATTYLLDIPDLLDVVQCWDDVVRSRLAESALWYAPLVQAGVALAKAYEKSQNRRVKFSTSLRRLCERAGVRYRSPHKLRHGHAVHALALAKDVADLKAISQNLMHSDLKTTDGIYGILKDEDVMTRIGGLTK